MFGQREDMIRVRRIYDWSARGHMIKGNSVIRLDYNFRFILA